MPNIEDMWQEPELAPSTSPHQQPSKALETLQIVPEGLQRRAMPLR